MQNSPGNNVGLEDSRLFDNLTEPVRAVPVAPVGIPTIRESTSSLGTDTKNTQFGSEQEQEQEQEQELPTGLQKGARGGFAALQLSTPDGHARRVGLVGLCDEKSATSTLGLPSSIPIEPAESIVTEPSRSLLGSSTNLFRERALRERGEEAAVEPLPEVTANHWALLTFLASTVLAVLGFGYFGRVEVTSVAPGVLLVKGGPRPVLAQVSGEVASLEINAGDFVQAGQEIARVQATELRARKQKSKEQLEVLRTNAQRLTAARKRHFKQAISGLWRKRKILAERYVVKSEAILALTQHAETTRMALEGTVATVAEKLAADEARRSAQQDGLLLAQQIADVDVELSDRAEHYNAEEQELERQLEEGEVSLAEAQKLTELEVVRAPVTGQVESLLVTEGQVVPNGATLGHIIPEGVTKTVVVLASMKDASFLRTGLGANIEFASLPVSEFGKAKAVVTRVSKDVATREEVTGLLGIAMAEPVIRVELKLLPGLTMDKVKTRLRPGERVTARLKTRERRIITLFFDFLRKWYPT